MACFTTSKHVKQRDTNLIEAPRLRLDERWLCKLIDERGGGGGGGVRRTVVSAGGSAAAEQKQEGFRPEAKLQIEI